MTVGNVNNFQGPGDADVPEAFSPWLGCAETPLSSAWMTSTDVSLS